MGSEKTIFDVMLSGDAVAEPWRHRGFLLPQVLQEHDSGECGNRWGYFHRICRDGLGEESIPFVDFSRAGMDRLVIKNLWKMADIVSRNTTWHSATRLIDWLAFGLGVSRDMPDFGDEVHQRILDAVDIRLFVRRPYDYFGDWLSEHKSGWNPNAFFPTPHEICSVMALMQMGGGDCRSKTVMDCCSGTGRLLLAASNYSLRLFGQDIDKTMVLACKANMSMYAPWGAFPDAMSGIFPKCIS